MIKKEHKLNQMKQRGNIEFQWVLPALVAGVSKFLWEAQTKRKVKFLDFAVHVMSAATSGFIVGSLCNAFHLDENIRNSLVAVAGWAGVTLIEVASKQLAILIPTMFERVIASLNVLVATNKKEDDKKD